MSSVDPKFLRDQVGEYLAWLVEEQGRPLAPDDYLFRAVKGGPFDRQPRRAVALRLGFRNAPARSAVRVMHNHVV